MLYDTLAAEILRCVRSTRDLECFAHTPVPLLADLDRYVRLYGTDAVRAIADALHQQPTSTHGIAALCTWIGSLDHPASYPLRLHLLEITLWHESLWMRHGAVLGLEIMADPHARPYLRAALARESVRVMQDDIRTILHYLTQPVLQERVVGESMTSFAD